MATERVFLLFACCIPVRGARRSTICDVQRQAIEIVPNGMYEVLTLHRGRTPTEIKAAYGNRFDEVVDQYFAFLSERELGFWCDDPEAFPPLDLTWERPELVTNAIVDVDRDSELDYAGIFAQLDELGCKALQLRVYDPLPIHEIERILSLTDSGRLRSIDLVVQHDPAWAHDTLDRLCAAHQRIANVFVHSAPAGEVRVLEGLGTTISRIPERVMSHEHCGQVHPAYFVSTLGLFTEAQAHNTCLNRKVSVDARGHIRNCPSMPRSYGHVSERSLASAVAEAGFRELWEVNKDRIDVCRDCEFRYVCTDCRAFISDASDVFSKPSRCRYDPYTATWASSPAGAPGEEAGLC